MDKRRARMLALGLAMTAPAAARADLMSDPTQFATPFILIGDYAHFMQSAGGSIDYGGATGILKWNFDPDVALHLEGGWHHVSFPTSDADDLSAGASLVFERESWHFGPALAVQSSLARNNNVNTFNYGGFAQYYTGLDMALSGWGGGLHTDAYRWNGFYLAGSAEWFPAPDLSLTGGSYFTDVPGGAFPFRETDVFAGVEWRPLPGVPVSLAATYGYSTFTTGTHANTIYLALKLYGGMGEAGAGAPLIAERYVAQDVSPIAPGLVFKF